MILNILAVSLVAWAKNIYFYILFTNSSKTMCV